MNAADWLGDNYIEVFGAVAGIVYVLLEIRQNIWLWPVGIVTSGVYIWVFFTSRFYADMSLQVYYLAISIAGWYWWKRKSESESESGRVGKSIGESKGELRITRVKFRTALVLAVVFAFLWTGMYLVLSRLTNSPVPGWDSFITSLSVVATWMLARKIYEHWYLWVIVNAASAIIFFARELYPTMILYIVYGTMSFAGMIEWRKTITETNTE